MYVELMGESGKVSEQKLRNNSFNQFERNQQDEFTISGSSVGKIKQVMQLYCNVDTLYSHHPV